MKKLLTPRVLFVAVSLFFLSTLALSAKSLQDKDELVIVAHITVKAENKDVLMKALEKVVAGTRTEAGNVAYDLYVDTSNPLKFTLIEVWKSQKAIDEHNQTAHFKEFVKAIEGKADLDVSVIKQLL